MHGPMTMCLSLGSSPVRYPLHCHCLFAIVSVSAAPRSYSCATLALFVHAQLSCLYAQQLPP